MHPQFGQLMKDATALTRAGDLQAAMASITAALNGGSPVAAAGAQANALHTDVSDASDVIDVAARVIEEREPTPATRPAPTTEAAQFVSGEYVHRAGKRDYRLFIPASRADKPRALILMLHGCTQSPDDFARGTRMNAIAAEHNALVLYPAQTRQANAQGCWNWFKHNHQGRGRGEPALLADLARHIADTHGVDPGHVFVAGLSAGGAMAAILATTHPDVFAAAGVHSGLPAGAARDLPGALAAMQGRAIDGLAGGAPSSGRMIVFHGDADSTVHPSNGDRVAAVHSGSAVSVEEQAGLQQGSRTCTRRLLKDASGRVVMEHWRLHGAGHAWSGGDPSGSYTDARGPDASAEMMRFFLQA